MKVVLTHGYRADLHTRCSTAWQCITQASGLCTRKEGSQLVRLRSDLVVLAGEARLVLLVQLLRGCAQDASGASLACQVSGVLPGVLDQAGLLGRDLSAQARQGPMLGLAPL